MDYKEAYTKLKSTTLSERLFAARYFAKNATSNDRLKLTEAKNLEESTWVINSLETAIERASDIAIPKVAKNKSVSKIEIPIQDSSSNDKYLHAKAVEEVSGTILHEFGNVIASILIDGPLEFDNYNGSNTCKQVNQLALLIGAIKELKKVSTTPTFTEFNISTLIDDILHLTRTQCDGIEIRLGGEIPFMVRADYGQLLIAVTNGLRNAIDAVNSPESRDLKIVINWGKAGSENFLVILDTGLGFKGDPQDAFKMGRSSKDGHIGFGLTTAKQAIELIDGTINVSNTADGACFEVRWSRENEDTDS